MAIHAHFNEHFTARLLESYKNIVLLTEASRQVPQRPPSQIYQDFTKELQELQRYEDGFIQIYGESPPPRLCGIHVSCLLVCRAIIFNHLNNHGAVEQHLRAFFPHRRGVRGHRHHRVWVPRHVLARGCERHASAPALRSAWPAHPARAPTPATLLLDRRRDEVR
ncbi:uncharacterized protein ACA1_310760 [Acanthamoeba castellanii str. Neff]|uniref:Uncharacterized protein n=1 Tax=Acanthamoeba castellanii (strain ATCC 30010 / Neff) TaxID=1257118 RepID=L8GTJ9_ACACF|nr:uncharacterized protein ACA1_310760 [Acanthamoeba castellanii str. Neff]ELR16247.1 hypothetical protein ACA1_310760 [Acanthamoeba castellanii str. Neff]